MPVPLPPLPEGNTTICLVIPDSPAWREIYMGSLLILQQWWYYDVGNSEDAEDAVQRAMACLYETQLNYEGCIELDCLDVQDCIENSPAIQDIINNISNAGNVNEQQRSSIYSQDVFDESLTCDYDILYGYCRAFWTYINTNNIDFLQKMAESSNRTEQLSELMSAIPIFGALPFDEVVGWVDNFTTYNLEAYESSITTEIEDEIVCDLMCIAINNDCHLTFDLVYEYMLERMGGYSALTIGATFFEMVVFMASGTYPSDRIVFIWTLLQLGCAFVATKFLGALGIRPYIIQALAGIPDDAWEVLCDDCASRVIVTFDDLTTDDYSLSISSSASWVMSDNAILQSVAQGNPTPSAFCGFGSPIANSNEGFNATVLITLPEVKTITDAKFEYFFKRGGASNVVARSIALYDETDTLIASVSSSANDGIQNVWTEFGGVSGVSVKYIKVAMSLEISSSVATPTNTQAYIDNVSWTQA